MKRFYVAVLAALWAGLCVVPVAQAFDEQAEREAIKKRVEEYTAAFNAHEAKKLAEYWLPNAVYVNPETGVEVEGREAIAKEFEEMFKSLKDVKLSVQVKDIQFVSPNVAVENGTAQLTYPDGKVDKSRYTAVHVKMDGKWYLDRVKEEEIPQVPSHYDKLKELEWMVGKWVDQDNEGIVETTCQWSRNKNFLIRWFKVVVEGRVDLAGLQIIGWDPAAKEIRSWVFDSDGGFAEGHWKKKGNSWFITVSGVLPDGRKASSVNIITYVDKDHFTWRSVNRTLDGVLLPNVEPVTVERVQAE